MGREISAASLSFGQEKARLVVNAQNEIVSMQYDPGNPAAGLQSHFEGRMISSDFNVSIKRIELPHRRWIEPRENKTAASDVLTWHGVRNGGGRRN